MHQWHKISEIIRWSSNPSYASKSVLIVVSAFWDVTNYRLKMRCQRNHGSQKLQMTSSDRLNNSNYFIWIPVLFNRCLRMLLIQRLEKFRWFQKLLKCISAVPSNPTNWSLSKNAQKIIKCKCTLLCSVSLMQRTARYDWVGDDLALLRCWGTV